jgi:hypothetical protein
MSQQYQTDFYNILGVEECTKWNELGPYNPFSFLGLLHFAYDYLVTIHTTHTGSSIQQPCTWVADYVNFDHNMGHNLPIMIAQSVIVTNLCLLNMKKTKLLNLPPQILWHRRTSPLPITLDVSPSLS